MTVAHLFDEFLPQRELGLFQTLVALGQHERAEVIARRFVHGDFFPYSAKKQHALPTVAQGRIAQWLPSWGARARLHRWVLEMARLGVGALHVHDLGLWPWVREGLRVWQRPVAIVLRPADLASPWLAEAGELATRLLCPSEALRMAAAERGLPAAKLCVVPPAVDPATWGQRQTPGADLPLSLVALAYDEASFDAELAISTLAQLRTQQPDARLVIAGLGRSSAIVTAAAARAGVTAAVKLYPHHFGALRAVLGQAAACIVPLQRSAMALPQELFAALRVGLPCLLTDSPAAQELGSALPHAIAMTAAGDAHALAAAVLRHYASPSAADPATAAWIDARHAPAHVASLMRDAKCGMRDAGCGMRDAR